MSVVTMCDSFVMRFFKDDQCPDVAPLLKYVPCQRMTPGFDRINRMAAIS